MWETPVISSYVASKQAILERNKDRLRDVTRVKVIAILKMLMTIGIEDFLNFHWMISNWMIFEKR